MTSKASAWGRLPSAMRELPQWAVSGADKAPLGLDSKGKLRNVSVVRPSEWMTFEQARQVAWDGRDIITTWINRSGVTISQTGYSIGFMLTESDPLSCIDLDVKDVTNTPDKPELWTTPDDFEFYLKIVKHYDSYTERSQSGKGLHIWVEGKIGRGFKRGGVEVYSQERYIISTGDVWIDKPIANRETMLQNMVTQMRPVAANIELEELPAKEDDWYVFQTAATAANADKFWALWKGKWSEEGYPSQSEADLALMSMLTFYSESNEQCRRMFRESGLAREKTCGKNNYHLNRLLKMIRSRQASEANVEFSALIKAAETIQSAAAAEIARLQGGVGPAQAINTPFGAQVPRTVAPLQVRGLAEPETVTPQAEAQLAQMAPVSPEAQAAGESGLGWPPGFIGALARFIYSSSYLPIKEVSIVAALGLMAGLCGKTWHIPKSGLNLYIILVARSAIGKEGMHDGVSTIVSACSKQMASFSGFVDFSEYASGPALIKACLAAPSFLNVSGEWGRRLKRLAAEDGKDGPLQSLRTQMTNLYQKSGPQSIAGGISYSHQDNNVASVSGVAYSMIGETTPGTFYESLTQSMMEDGFLSRFVVIGYDGDRPNKNESIVLTPDDAIVTHLCALATQAERMISTGDSQPVGRTDEAAAIIDAWSKECSANIKQTDDESRRQMWNRAELKSLRIAALLAVSDHYSFPVINKTHIEWAISLIRQDIGMMTKRLESGDVGSSDDSRQRKLIAILQDYLGRKGDMPKGYNINEKMRANAIVPYHYLQTRAASAAVFYNHKLGTNKAIIETIGQCVASGYLMEVKQEKLVEGYDHHGKGWRILTLPDYSAVGKKVADA